MTSDAASGLVNIRSTRIDAARAEEARARRARWADLKPNAAMLYVENRCNLRCDHCYESEDTHPAHPDDGALTLPEYDRLLDELAQLGVLYLALTGGEIFLRRDLLDLVELARKKRFAVTLYTSGYHIDEAKADRIAALKVSMVEISLYSHDPAVHDGFTGIPGSHRRSVRALQLLHDRGVKTRLKANVMTFNVDHLDELIALALRVGAQPRLDPTVKPKMNGDRRPLDYAVPPDEIRRKVLSRPELYRAFRAHEPDNICRGEASLIGEGTLCGAGRDTLAIGADGSLLACGFFATSAGNVRDGKLDEVWYESELLDTVRQTRMKDMASCPSCELNSTCQPCMAYSLIEHGDHRQCSSGSRQGASAIRLLAERKAAANRKMEGGRPLQVVQNDFQTPESVSADLWTEP